MRVYDPGNKDDCVSPVRAADQGWSNERFPILAACAQVPPGEPWRWRIDVRGSDPGLALGGVARQLGLDAPAATTTTAVLEHPGGADTATLWLMLLVATGFNLFI